jgi:uroporphyrinogen-III synthase
MPRVLITRPEPGATRTVRRLAARGIDAVAIPVTGILPLAHQIPDANFDALIITSHNAMVHGAELLTLHQSKPAFVVGERTAELLRNQGFRHVIAAQTAQDLLPLIIARPPNRALYLCGQIRKPELEAGLAAAGITTTAVEVYMAKPENNAPAMLVSFFQHAPDSIVLCYAPSAAAAFVAAVQHQDLPPDTRFLCMSATIAAQLPAQWQKNTSIAMNPDDAAMSDQLHKMLDKKLATNRLPRA